MNETKKDKFINIILKKENVIKELEKSFLFKYDDVKTFFFPKRLIFKKVISQQGDRMFDKLDINDQNYSYVTLSIPKDSTFKDIEICEPMQEENSDGEIINKRDENNRVVYKKEKISIYDLKNHFRDESNDIFNEVKMAKNIE